MYRCQVPFCNVNVPGNTPALRIVVESREKEYPARENANKIRISGKKKPILKSDRGGVGSEIVRELKVCRRCYDSFFAEELDLSRL